MLCQSAQVTFLGLLIATAPTVGRAEAAQRDHASPPTPPARGEALKAHITALEKSLWEDKSPGGSATAHLLADDFEIIKHGHRFSKSEDSEESKNVQVASFTMEDVEARLLSPSVVLLTYRSMVAWKGRYRGKDLASFPPRLLWVASIWVWRGGKWVNVFFEENRPDDLY